MPTISRPLLRVVDQRHLLRRSGIGCTSDICATAKPILICRVAITRLAASATGSANTQVPRKMMFGKPQRVHAERIAQLGFVNDFVDNFRNRARDRGFPKNMKFPKLHRCFLTVSRPLIGRSRSSSLALLR